MTVFVRWLAFAIWGYATWIVLTWTLTVEQLVFGAILASAAGAASLSLGDAARPRRMFQPRRFLRLLCSGGYVLFSLVKANVGLAIRIWRPSRPLQPGMVIVESHARSDGGLTGVGILSSLIVDNQLIDVDRKRHHLQYHGVAVGAGTPSEHREEITGDLERLIVPLERQ